MTAIAMAGVVVIAAFLGLIGLRLFPIYMEHFKVASHLEDYTKDPDLFTYSDKQILDGLLKRFQIDDVVHVTKDEIFIERSGKKSGVIAIEYEVRKTAIGNVDMVVSFEDEVEVR